MRSTKNKNFSFSLGSQFYNILRIENLRSDSTFNITINGITFTIPEYAIIGVSDVITQKLMTDPTLTNFSFDVKFNGRTTQEMISTIFHSSNEEEGKIEFDPQEHFKESLDFHQFGIAIGSKLFSEPFIFFLKMIDQEDITISNVMERLTFKVLAQKAPRMQPDSISHEKENLFIANHITELGKTESFIEFFKKEENMYVSEEIFALISAPRYVLPVQNQDDLLDIIINICNHCNENSFFKPFNLLKYVQSQFCSCEKFSEFFEFLKNNDPFVSPFSKDVLTFIQKRIQDVFISKRTVDEDMCNGCLSYLRNEITAILPRVNNTQLALTQDIKGIIGTKEPHNVHNTPYLINAFPDWENNHPYFEIHFGNYYIYPTSYSLRGRRNPFAEWGHLLKGWKLSGFNQNGEWIPLDEHSSKSDRPFTPDERRTFPLTAKEAFKSFKIEMTEPNTCGHWAFCLGQIEIYGDIFIKSQMDPLKRNITHQK